jgi:hypothetical protein
MALQSMLLALVFVVSGATGSFAQEQTTTTSPPQTIIRGTLPSFPASNKCSTSTPCRNVAGEIVRIEES